MNMQPHVGFFPNAESRKFPLHWFTRRLSEQHGDESRKCPLHFRRVAVGGAEAWPQVHPGVVRAGRGPVSGARRPRAGGYRLSRPYPG